MDDVGRDSSSPRKRRVPGIRVLIILLVLVLEIFAALYIYSTTSGGAQGPVIFPSMTTSSGGTTTTATTRTVVPDKISVKSATIENDTLMLEVHNSGPNETTLLTISSICTPGFKSCYSYQALSGSLYQSTFVLPAGKTFPENLTKVCTAAIAKCGNYLPSANSTYYMQINFTFADHSVVTVPVSAFANDTWSSRLTGVTGAGSQTLGINESNLFGELNVTVLANDSLPYASWETRLNLFSSPTTGFAQTVATNSTGCAGSPPSGVIFKSGGKLLNVTYTADCSQPLVVEVPLTSVQTGITVGSYYLVAVCDTTHISSPKGYPDNSPSSNDCFALWVQAKAEK